MKTANQIVRAAVDAAGEAGGFSEVCRIAEHGAGNMEFSDEDMGILNDAFGGPVEALNAVQNEARSRVPSDV